MFIDLSKADMILILCLVQEEFTKFLLRMKSEEPPSLEEIQDSYAFIHTAIELLPKIIEVAEDLTVKGGALELLRKIETHVTIQEIPKQKGHPGGITLIRSEETGEFR